MSSEKSIYSHMQCEVVIAKNFTRFQLSKRLLYFERQDFSASVLVEKKHSLCDLVEDKKIIISPEGLVLITKKAVSARVYTGSRALDGIVSLAREICAKYELHSLQIEPLYCGSELYNWKYCVGEVPEAQLLARSKNVEGAGKFSCADESASMI